MSKSPKFKIGDLVLFNAPDAFGGEFVKIRNHHYQNPGVVVSVLHNRAFDKFSYKVWWGSKETSEHECYLYFPNELDK